MQKSINRAWIMDERWAVKYFFQEGLPISEFLINFVAGFTTAARDEFQITLAIWTHRWSTAGY